MASTDITSFDFLVIGGGSAGIGACRNATEMGASVGLIEHRLLGGICANVGVIPKKFLYWGAQHAISNGDRKFYGLNEATPGFNWSTLQTSMAAYVKKMNIMFEDELATTSVKHIKGYGKFLSSKVVEVDGKKYTGKHILIACGGDSSILDIPGAEHTMTHDYFYQLEDLPKKVAVVGGGYIAIEFAGVLNALGSKTTLFMRNGALKHFDQMISENVVKNMEEAGVKVVNNSESISVYKQPNGKLEYKTTAGTFRDFDVLVWACGRTPNTSNLGLEKAGVKVDSNGYILVDEYNRTGVKDLYALGDCCGKSLLTPVAIRSAGRKMAQFLFNSEPGATVSKSGLPLKMNYDNITSVVFSHPAIGAVGLTQEAAVEKYGAANVKIYETNFENLYFVMTERKQQTIMKIVCVGPEEKVVGLHMIGRECEEMITGFAVAIKMGATKRDFDETIGAHPTASETIVTMRTSGPRNPFP